MSSIYKTSSNNCAAFLLYHGYSFTLEEDLNNKVYFKFDATEEGFFDCLQDFKDACKDRRSVYVDYARLIYLQDFIRKSVRIYKENKKVGVEVNER